ncbi:MAG: PadR family transcriptional regulator [Gaiellaceae bacterium]
MPERQLTPVSYVVLGLVSEGATTPYDMKQKASRSVGYFWSFPHSQLYAEPARLARLGFLAEQREPGGRHRRVYTITPAGRQALDAWVREPTREPTQIRDTGLLKLFFGEGLGPDELSALARAQEEAHQARLAVYESIEPEIEHPQHGATLRAGLLFEQLLVDFWRELAESPTPR